MKFKVPVGSRGQVVIPKVVRESLGIKTDGEIFMEVKGNSVEIKTIVTEDIVSEWEQTAKKRGGDLKKMGFSYGDKLYEEIF